MTIRKCSCGVILTTKNCIRGRRLKDYDLDQLCLTCKNCKSSTILFRELTPLHIQLPFEKSPEKT